MPPVDQFLSDVGAGSLSTAVALPAGPPGADGPAAQLFKRIDDEVTATNDRTLALLKDNWDDFAGQLKHGDELVAKLDEEDKELAQLELEVDGPDAFLPPLVAQLEEQQSLAASHLAATASVSLLSALVTFHTTTAALATATTSGELPAAIEALARVTSAVEEGADEWIEHTDAWKVLVRWASEEESRLEAALQGSLEGCFDVSPAAPGGGGTATMTLRESIAAAPTGHELPVAVLLQGLEDLAAITGRPTQTEALLARLAKQVLRHFVAPFLESQGRVNVGASEPAVVAQKPRVAFRFRDDGVTHVAELGPVDEQVDAVPALSDFLAFFTSHTALFPRPGSGDKPSKHAATLTAHLTPSLQSHIISSHLSPSLPSSTSDLPAYLALVAAASTFESTFLPSHGLFAFLPSSFSSSSREVEEQRVIRTWAARVPQHWARQVGDRALARVRGAVKAWDWGAGETVEVEVVEEDEMLGLLLGLGLADEQLPAQGGATAAAGQQAPKVPRELALATVPRGAQREMTIEEALAPKVVRPKTPPPPSPSASPAPAPADEPAHTAGKGSLKRGKLGAARIAAPLPPRSPSPPPLFQGGDAPAREAASATSREAAPEPPSPPSPAAAAAPEPAHEPPPAPTIAIVEASPAPEPHALDRSAVISPTLSPRGQHTTFELLEEPASTLDGIETTADHAGEGEVGGVHSYAAAVDDGVEASPEQDEEEERDGSSRVRVEEVEETAPATEQGDAPDAPALLPHDAGEHAVEGHDIKEESVDPEIPRTSSPGLAASPSSHSPSLGLTYDEPSPSRSDVEPLRNTDDERVHDEETSAAVVDEFAGEAQPYAVDEDAWGHDEASHEHSPYAPSPYEPPPYQPASHHASVDDVEPAYFDRSAAPRDPHAPSSPPSHDAYAPSSRPPSHDAYAPHPSTAVEPDSHEEDDWAAREQYGADAGAHDTYAPVDDEQGGYDVEYAEHGQYAPVDAPRGCDHRFDQDDDPYAPTSSDAERPEHGSYGVEDQYGVESQPVAAHEPRPSEQASFPWSSEEHDPYLEQQDSYPPPHNDEYDTHDAQTDNVEHDPYAPSSAPAHEPVEPAPAGFSSLAAPAFDDDDPYADEAEHDWYAQEEHDWYAQEDQAFTPLEQAQPSYPVGDQQQPEHSAQSSPAHEHSALEPAHDPYAPVEPVHDPYRASECSHGVDSAHEPLHDPYAPVDSQGDSHSSYGFQQPEHEHDPYAPQDVNNVHVLSPYDPDELTPARPPPPPAHVESEVPRSAAPPPPPRAAGAPPPPRASGRLGAKRRPVYTPQYDVGPSSSSSSSSSPAPVAPLATPFQQAALPPRTVISPPPEEQQHAYAPMVPPIQPSAPAVHNPYVPALSTRSSNNSLARSLPSRPTSAQRNDGPVLNHIQQRFASPPPTMASPYVPLSIPPSAPSAGAGSYLPANDPLFADLFGNGSNKSTRSGNFFVPDRQQSAPSPSQAAYGHPQHEQAYGYGLHPQQAQGGYGGGYGAPAEDPYGAPSSSSQQQQQQQQQQSYGQQYSLYGYEQPAMRMRGGGGLELDSEEEEESEEDEEEEDRPILRLRGGADLGDMDDDDGNRSADDWGFGDDAGAEEDAWGFDDDAAPPTPPSPPLLKKAAPPPVKPEPPQPTAVRSPPAPAPPSLASSVRPPSHAPSASITSVASSSGSLSRSRPPSYAYTPSLAPPPLASSAVADAEDEPAELGDDAWGFGEEDEDAAPPSPRPAESAQPSAALAEPAPPSPPLPAPVAPAEPPSVAPPTSTIDGDEHHVGAGGDDDWGFGAEDDVADEVDKDAVEAQVIAEQPNDDYEEAVEPAEVVRDSPLRSLFNDEVVAEQPMSARAVEPEQEEQQVEEDDEDGWGIDEHAAVDEPLEHEPVSSLEHVSDDAVSAADAAPVDERDGQVDLSASSVKEDSPAEPVEQNEQAHQDVVEDGEPIEKVDQATTGQDHVELDHTAAEPATVGQPDKGRRRASIDVDATEPSALNLPAENIDQAFPSSPAQREPSLPLIPEPMPHHDLVEPLAESPTREAALADAAAAPIDDAAQLFDGGDTPENDWGLGAADDGAAPAELAAFDTFAADAKDEDAQDDDLPVSSALFDPQPVDLDDDFVDFNAVVEAEEQPTTPEWEPFEEPGNQPITSPPLDAQTTTSHDDLDDVDALSPMSLAVPPPDLEQLVGEEPRAQEAAAARPELAAAVAVDPAVNHSTREGSMSSPEVIEHADAWDFDREQGGAELLDASAPAPDVAGDDVDESQVQHELERPTPRDDSAVQHEAERPLVVNDADAGPIILPAQDAHPQQRTFSPPPSMVPAGDDDVDEAGWDWQDDAGAEALLDPHVAVTAEGPVPVSGESSVQHEADRPSVDDDAVALAESALAPSAPEPVVEPVSAAPQDDAHDPGQDQGAELLQEEPALDVEQGAESVEDESTVQHVEERPVLPAAAVADEDALPAKTIQPELHTFSPPLSALPSATEDDAPRHVVDDTVDDPWDLEPVEPETPPEPSPPLDAVELGPGAEALDAVADEPTAAATSSPDRATPSSPSGVDNAAHDEPLADPLEHEVVDELVGEPAVEGTSASAQVEPDHGVAGAAAESSVQHEQDRPVVDDGAGVAASETQPQEHAFTLPASSLPAENAPLGAPADPVEVVAPSLPASPPPAPQADQAWGWDGEGEGDASRSEPVVDIPEAITSIPPVPVAPPPAPAPSSLPPSATVVEREVPLESSTAVPKTPAPQHARAMSTDDWGWDADEKEPVRDDAPSAAVAPEPVVAEQQQQEQASDVPPAPAPPRREQMMVSKQSREVVAIAEEILLEAVKVASPSFDHPDFAPAAAPLLQTFISLLSLYRATAAVHNSRLLASVPAIGMQFANDAEYIGREVERVWRTATDDQDLPVAPGQAKDVQLAIETTRQLGRDTRQKQIAIQRAALMESLDEAGGFLRTSDEARFQSCERALQQVMHILQRLALVWKPVMTPTALYTSLGGLINEVLLRVLDEIEEQTDISEDESIRLNKLCKMLHDLESLFDGSETSLGREAPAWYKFAFLSELLEASMADILFLFDHGHLVDFTPQEIVRLVRALFADSPLRNRNIEKILRGHPEAPPADEEWAE
ncbi:hypothetical protein JCM8208_005428 [Rhodotorula glutinis]